MDEGQNHFVVGTPQTISSGTGDIVLSSGGGEKKRNWKRWVVIGGIVMVVVLVVGLSVAGANRRNGSGETEDAVEVQDPVELVHQFNYDLSVLEDDYRGTFGQLSDNGEGNNSAMLMMGVENMTQWEDDLREVEKEAELLPNAEGVGLTGEKASEYSAAMNEALQRLEIIKSGMGLARDFHEAFFWPIAGIDDAELGVSSADVQKKLLSDERANVRSVAEVFEALYQLVKGDANEAELSNFLAGHPDIVEKYYACFQKIGDSEELYRRISNVMEGLE